MPDATSGSNSEPTIVLLHHFGGSTRSWTEVLDDLGPDYPTRAIDLRGFGDAAREGGPYRVADYAETIGAAIRASGAAATIVVGHSMGGKIALAYAAKRPTGLRALLLLAPSPPTPEPIDDANRQASIEGWASYDFASQTLAKITADPLPEAIRDRAIADMLHSGRAAWDAWLEEGSREDISSDMQRIDIPVTILSGTGDTVISTALLHREVQGRIPTSRIETIAGTGHLINMEAPRTVASAIRRMVSAVA